MFTYTRRLFLMILLTFFSACASNQFTTTTSAPNGVTLKSSQLYVYSFLDIRDTEFGPNMLTEFDRQLVAELGKVSVTAKVLRFKESEVGKYFSTTNSGMTVPIGKTIENNLTEERSLEANYRLIIFPSKMTISGAWKYYDVRWELFDVKTNQRVWVTTSQGKHMNFATNDEDPQNRAKTIIDGLVGELQKSNLL